MRAADFNTAWSRRSALQKKPGHQTPTIWHEEGESAHLQYKECLQSCQPNSYCLSPKSPHDFTPQLCLISVLIFFHGKKMQCFADTIKTVQASALLWPLKDWLLCPGIFMEEILIGVCVCVSGYAQNIREKGKTSKSQGKTLTSHLLLSVNRQTQS